MYLGASFCMQKSEFSGLAFQKKIKTKFSKRHSRAKDQRFTKANADLTVNIRMSETYLDRKRNNETVIF